jgi:exodeoxyribonuclease-1
VGEPAGFSFYWHDYETFGIDPRRDRPAQFAGLRTDAELNEIDAPAVHYCRPADDFLPAPESCLLTGILPQTCLERGLPERDFADAIMRELATPNTAAAGYNSIRFDAEFTRFLFWRSLLDPYAHEWRDGCARWDLLDVLRCCHALRPDGIVWPQRDDGSGRTSFKLEHLTRANGLAHDNAHDALADVRATIALARLVRARQPRLWEFCLKLRDKNAVIAEITQAQSQGRPLLHVSGRYAAERGAIALVWPLAPHPFNKNELIVWDLAQDPQPLFELDAAAIRERLYTRADALPEGMTRLAIKTIHLNRSPIVIGNLGTLKPEQAERWGIDVEQALRHADTAARQGKLMAGIWPDVYRRESQTLDVDEDLYGGFVGDDDRRQLQRLRALAPEQLADKHPAFADARLDELLFRFRARNHPSVLSDDERARWHAHRAARLHDGAHGALTLAAYAERIDALQETHADNARAQAILEALVDYAEGIAP